MIRRRGRVHAMSDRMLRGVAGRLPGGVHVDCFSHPVSRESARAELRRRKLHGRGRR